MPEVENFATPGDRWITGNSAELFARLASVRFSRHRPTFHSVKAL